MASLNGRLILPPLLALVGLVMLGGISLLTLENVLRSTREAQIKSVVEVAVGVVARYEAREKAGILTHEAAQEQAREAVKAMRYSGAEYLWINDLGRPVPRMVMHPTVPSLDGKLLDDARFNKATRRYDGSAGGERQLNGQNLFVAFVDVVEKNGDGFVAYQWPKPKADGTVTAELYPKLSYVKKFEPWGWVIGTGIYADDLDNTFWQMSFWITVVAGSCVIVLLLVSAFVRRRVLAQVGGEPVVAVEVAQRIAGGDLLTPAANGNGGLPHDSVIGALEAMRRELELLVSAIVQHANHLSKDMGILTSDASNMGVRLSLQRGAGEEVLAAVEEMQEKVRYISALAMETEGRAQDISQRSAAGQRSVGDSASGMHALAASIRNSSENVRQLVAQAESIGAIVVIIKGIADQTNLLALNAAIEAARAGEQGRGFAVVADEVRKLAERTSSATGDISRMIGQIRGEIDRAVAEMESAVPLVEKSVVAAESTKALLEDFCQVSAGAFDQMQTLAQVVAEQVTNANNIVGVVGQSIAITQQASDMVESTSEVATRADKTSAALFALTERFKTNVAAQATTTGDARNFALEWSDRLAVGEASIDEQHRRLIDLFNQFHAALSAQGTRAAVGQVLDALVDYTKFHFAHEAGLMEKSGYPDSPDHLARHDDLISRAVEYKVRFETGEAVGAELTHFFRDWLVNHILKTDRKLAAFLRGDKPRSPLPAIAEAKAPPPTAGGDIELF